VSELDPWDAGILIYCDAHTPEPLGPYVVDCEPPLRRGVHYWPRYLHRTDYEPPRWVADVALADWKINLVLRPRPAERYLDARGDDIPLQTTDLDRAVAALDSAGEDNALAHPHLLFRHKNCKRTLRLTERRLFALLDRLAAQGVTGVSLAFLEEVNRTARHAC
jgi:hypothetical protein